MPCVPVYLHDFAPKTRGRGCFLYHVGRFTGIRNLGHIFRF